MNMPVNYEKITEVIQDQAERPALFLREFPGNIHKCVNIDTNSQEEKTLFRNYCVRQSSIRNS